MTIVEFQAGQARDAARMVAHWVATTSPDKLEWEPKPEAESQPRCILKQMGECVRVNRMFTAVLRNEKPPQSETEWNPSNTDEAQAELIQSADEFADALAALDDSVIEREFPMPWGPMPGKMVITLPTLNMNYHGGQINYIQCLYGDTVFHFPGGA